MREILFRGFHPDKNGEVEITKNKNKIKGKWVYGYYFIDSCSHYILRYSVLPDLNNIDKLEIIPETLGQFIGKFDKYEKQIYEKDNCIYTDEFLATHNNFIDTPNAGTVFWDETFLGYSLTNKINIENEDINWSQVEVVGNVFEI